MATIADPKEGRRVPIPAVRAASSDGVSLIQCGANQESASSRLEPSRGGWLLKLSPTAFTGYQRRFFRISESDCALLYWKSEPEYAAEPLGSINLSGVLAIHIIDALNFAIKTPGRDYCLRADRPSEKDLWLEAINHVVNHSADADSIEDARNQFDFSKLLVDATNDLTNQVWDLLRFNKKATWLKDDATPLTYSVKAKARFLEAKGLVPYLHAGYEKSITDGRTAVLPERFIYVGQDVSESVGRLAGIKALERSSQSNIIRHAEAKPAEAAVSPPPASEDADQFAQRLLTYHGHLNAALQVRSQTQEARVGPDLEELQRVVSHYKSRRRSEDPTADPSAPPLIPTRSPDTQRHSTFNHHAMSFAAMNHGQAHSDSAPPPPTIADSKARTGGGLPPIPESSLKHGSEEDVSRAGDSKAPGATPQIAISSPAGTRASCLPAESESAVGRALRNRDSFARIADALAPMTKPRISSETPRTANTTDGERSNSKLRMQSKGSESKDSAAKESLHPQVNESTVRQSTSTNDAFPPWFDHVLFGTLNANLGDESLNGEYYCLLIGSRPLAHYQTFLPLPSVFTDFELPMGLKLDTLYLFELAMDDSPPAYIFDLDNIVLSNQIYETDEGFCFRLKVFHSPAANQAPAESLTVRDLYTLPRGKIRASVKLTSIFGPDTECWREALFACCRGKRARAMQRPRYLLDELMAFDLTDKVDANQKIDYVFRYCISEVVVARMHVHMNVVGSTLGDADDAAADSDSVESDKSITDPHDLACAVNAQKLLGLIAVHSHDIPLSMPLKAIEVFCDQAGDFVAAAAETCYLHYVLEGASAGESVFTPSSGSGPIRRAVSTSSGSVSLAPSVAAPISHSSRKDELIDPLAIPKDGKRPDMLRFFLDAYGSKVVSAIAVIWCDKLRENIMNFARMKRRKSVASSLCSGESSVHDGKLSKKTSEESEDDRESDPDADEGDDVSLTEVFENVLTNRTRRNFVTGLVNRRTILSFMDFVSVFNVGFKQFGIYDNAYAVTLDGLAESLTRRMAHAEHRNIFKILAKVFQETPFRDTQRSSLSYSVTGPLLIAKIFERFYELEAAATLPLILTPPPRHFLPEGFAEPSADYIERLKQRTGGSDFDYSGRPLIVLLRRVMLNYARYVMTQFQMELRNVVYALILSPKLACQSSQDSTEPNDPPQSSPNQISSVASPLFPENRFTTARRKSCPGFGSTGTDVLVLCSLVNSIPLFIQGCEAIDRALGVWNPVVCYEAEQTISSMNLATQSASALKLPPTFLRKSSGANPQTASSPSIRPRGGNGIEDQDDPHMAELYEYIESGYFDTFAGNNLRFEAKRFTLLENIIVHALAVRCSHNLTSAIDEKEDLDSTIPVPRDGVCQKLLALKLRMREGPFQSVATQTLRLLVASYVALIMRSKKAYSASQTMSRIHRIMTIEDSLIDLVDEHLPSTVIAPSIGVLSFLRLLTDSSGDQLLILGLHAKCAFGEAVTANLLSHIVNAASCYSETFAVEKIRAALSGDVDPATALKDLQKTEMLDADKTDVGNTKANRCAGLHEDSLGDNVPSDSQNVYRTELPLRPSRRPRLPPPPAHSEGNIGSPLHLRSFPSSEQQSVVQRKPISKTVPSGAVDELAGRHSLLGLRAHALPTASARRERSNGCADYVPFYKVPYPDVLREVGATSQRGAAAGVDDSASSLGGGTRGQSVEFTSYLEDILNNRSEAWWAAARGPVYSTSELTSHMDCFKWLLIVGAFHGKSSVSSNGRAVSSTTTKLTNLDAPDMNGPITPPSPTPSLPSSEEEDSIAEEIGDALDMDATPAKNAFGNKNSHVLPTGKVNIPKEVFGSVINILFITASDVLFQHNSSSEPSSSTGRWTSGLKRTFDNLSTIQRRPLVSGGTHQTSPSPVLSPNFHKDPTKTADAPLWPSDHLLSPPLKPIVPLIPHGRRKLAGWLWRRGEVRTGVALIQGAPSRLYHQSYSLGTAEAFGGEMKEYQREIKSYVTRLSAEQQQSAVGHRKALEGYVAKYVAKRNANQAAKLKQLADNGEDTSAKAAEFAKMNLDDDASIAGQLLDQLAQLNESFRSQTQLRRLQKICQGALDGWRRLWCSVGNQEITFHHDPEDTIPADVVSLYSLDGLKLSQVLSDEKDETQTMFILLYGERHASLGVEIDVYSLEVHLRADSPEDRKLWVETLTQMSKCAASAVPEETRVAAERQRYCENVTSLLTVFDPVHLQPHNPQRASMRRRYLNIDIQ